MNTPSSSKTDVRILVEALPSAPKEGLEPSFSSSPLSSPSLSKIEQGVGTFVKSNNNPCPTTSTNQRWKRESSFLDCSNNGGMASASSSWSSTTKSKYDSFYKGGGGSVGVWTTNKAKNERALMTSSNDDSTAKTVTYVPTKLRQKTNQRWKLDDSSISERKVQSHDDDTATASAKTATTTHHAGKSLQTSLNSRHDRQLKRSGVKQSSKLLSSPSPRSNNNHNKSLIASLADRHVRQQMRSYKPPSYLQATASLSSSSDATDVQGPNESSKSSLQATECYKPLKPRHQSKLLALLSIDADASKSSDTLLEQRQSKEITKLEQSSTLMTKSNDDSVAALGSCTSQRSKQDIDGKHVTWLESAEPSTISPRKRGAVQASDASQSYMETPPEQEVALKLSSFDDTTVKLEQPNAVKDDELAIAYGFDHAPGVFMQEQQLDLTIDLELAPKKEHSGYVGMELASITPSVAPSKPFGGSVLPNTSHCEPTRPFPSMNVYGSIPEQQWHIPPDFVMAMDCEMVGVGKDGKRSMLARVSLVDWNGAVLFDTFVIPTEPVTDYRTFVSGVRPHHLATPPAMDVRVCRDLVQNWLHHKPILVGHGLSNDLAALQLTHPQYQIRDSATFLPFTKPFRGGPRRLKDLVAIELDSSIQADGQEHCSIEDARAAMELYKHRQKEWDICARHKLCTEKVTFDYSFASPYSRS